MTLTLTLTLTLGSRASSSGRSAAPPPECEGARRNAGNAPADGTPAPAPQDASCAPSAGTAPAPPPPPPLALVGFGVGGIGLPFDRCGVGGGSGGGGEPWPLRPSRWLAGFPGDFDEGSPCGSCGESCGGGENVATLEGSLPRPGDVPLGTVAMITPPVSGITRPSAALGIWIDRVPMSRGRATPGPAWGAGGGAPSAAGARAACTQTACVLASIICSSRCVCSSGPVTSCPCRLRKAHRSGSGSASAMHMARNASSVASGVARTVPISTPESSPLRQITLTSRDGNMVAGRARRGVPMRIGTCGVVGAGAPACGQKGCANSAPSSKVE